MDVSPTVEDVESAEHEDFDFAKIVDPVVGLGMSDEVEDAGSGEVSTVFVSPTVEDVLYAEVDDADIAIIDDPVVVHGM